MGRYLWYGNYGIESTEDTVPTSEGKELVPYVRYRTVGTGTYLSNQKIGHVPDQISLVDYGIKNAFNFNTQVPVQLEEETERRSNYKKNNSTCVTTHNRYLRALGTK